MEILLPWQPKNWAITQLSERILNSYLTHMYFWIKHITGLPGCYGSAVTMAKIELCNKSLKRKYFKCIFGRYVLCIYIIQYICLIYVVVMEALLLETRKVYHIKIILEFYCLRETRVDFVGV